MVKKTRNSSVKEEHSEVLQSLKVKKEKLVQCFKEKKIIKSVVFKPTVNKQPVPKPAVAHTYNPPVLQIYKPTEQIIIGDTVIERAQSNVQNWCNRQKIDLHAVQNIAALLKYK